MVSDEIMLDFGEVTLSRLDDDQVWVCWKSGEGASMSRAELADFLIKYLKENF